MSTPRRRVPQDGGTITDSGSSGPAGVPRVYRLRSPHSVDRLLAACTTAVEDWGGEWTSHEQGGELRLPVQAGLRRGVVRGRATTSRNGAGSELSVEVADTAWRLDRSAVVLLVTAALAAVALVLWPFYPALAKLAPLGLVLGASVWLVILARLRHEGPAELLAQVESALEGPDIKETDAEEPPMPITPR